MGGELYTEHKARIADELWDTRKENANVPDVIKVFEDATPEHAGELASRWLQEHPEYRVVSTETKENGTFAWITVVCREGD